MNISNRSLVLLLVVTLILVGGAAALTVGLSMKDAADAPVVVATLDVPVVPEVIRKGGKPIDPKGPLLVAVTKGTTAASASLKCDMFVAERPMFEGGMAFESIPFGDCQMTLLGATKGYGPVYPGDRLECGISDGATVCTGGIAADKAGTVTITSAAGGKLTVDGEEKGALPADAVKLRVGKRAVVVTLDDGRKMSWNLVVQPEETISVAFPAPAGWVAPPSVGAAFAPSVMPAVEQPAHAAASSAPAPAAPQAPPAAPAPQPQ